MNIKILAVLFAGLVFFPQSKPRSVLHVESLEYPSAAHGAQIQGDVILHAQVEPDGHVLAAILASGTLVLAEDAINNLRTWKFEPSDKEEYIEVVYHFVLVEPKVFNPRTTCKFDLPNSVTVISNRYLPETTGGQLGPRP